MTPPEPFPLVGLDARVSDKRFPAVRVVAGLLLAMNLAGCQNDRQSPVMQLESQEERAEQSQLTYLKSLESQPEKSWIPLGGEEVVRLYLSDEARKLLNQFPLVQILDEVLDLTTNVVLFRVRDAQGKEFHLFYRYFDQTWIKAVQRPDGSWATEPYTP